MEDNRVSSNQSLTQQTNPDRSSDRGMSPQLKKQHSLIKSSRSILPQKRRLQKKFATQIVTEYSVKTMPSGMTCYAMVPVKKQVEVSGSFYQTNKVNTNVNLNSNQNFAGAAAGVKQMPNSDFIGVASAELASHELSPCQSEGISENESGRTPVAQIKDPESKSPTRIQRNKAANLHESRLSHQKQQTENDTTLHLLESRNMQNLQTKQSSFGQNQSQLSLQQNKPIMLNDSEYTLPEPPHGLVLNNCSKIDLTVGDPHHNQLFQKHRSSAFASYHQKPAGNAAKLTNINEVNNNKDGGSNMGILTTPILLDNGNSPARLMSANFQSNQTLTSRATKMQQFQQKKARVLTPQHYQRSSKFRENLLQQIQARRDSQVNRSKSPQPTECGGADVNTLGALSDQNPVKKALRDKFQENLKKSLTKDELEEYQYTGQDPRASPPRRQTTLIRLDTVAHKINKQNKNVNLRQGNSQSKDNLHHFCKKWKFDPSTINPNFTMSTLETDKQTFLNLQSRNNSVMKANTEHRTNQHGKIISEEKSLKKKNNKDLSKSHSRSPSPNQEKEHKSHHKSHHKHKHHKHRHSKEKLSPTPDLERGSQTSLKKQKAKPKVSAIVREVLAARAQKQYNQADGEVMSRIRNGNVPDDLTFRQKFYSINTRRPSRLSEDKQECVKDKFKRVATGVDQYESTLMEYPKINVALDADTMWTKMKPFYPMPKKKRDCCELLKLLDDTQAMDAHNSQKIYETFEAESHVRVDSYLETFLD